MSETAITVEGDVIDIQEVNVDPENLQRLDQADRSEWDQEMYQSALDELLTIRSYNYWVIGKFVHEIRERWQTDFEVIADSIGKKCSPNTLRSYCYVYRKFIQDNPAYVPTGRLPYNVMSMAAATDKPAETAAMLEDENAVTPKHAYKTIKEKETGIVLPSLPRMSFKWNEDKTKIIPYLFAQEATLPLIDWQYLQSELLDIYERDVFKNS